MLRDSLASIPSSYASPSPVGSPNVGRWAGWRPWRASGAGAGSVGGSVVDYETAPEDGGSGPGPGPDINAPIKYAGGRGPRNTDMDTGREREGEGGGERSGDRDMDRKGGRDRDSAVGRDIRRASGINQPGAIPGFSEFMAQARRKVPRRVRQGNVDREALGDVWE